MAKDVSDKWKKEVELLNLKLNEYEETIRKLQSDDSTQDAKIENLNKLHSQKVRALMQSIQELKKQNASIRALNKENNRSKLIEKLKTELVQQEIAIQALRDLIADNEKSDEQIIKYLNKGPPRIRPLSREEMKMKIRKLEGRLGISKKTPGDQAVDDLESMLNPSKSQESEDFKLVDPLQNEKIVELMEHVQSIQLELRSKDSIIEHLRSQIKKLQEELQIYKNRETEDKILSLRSDGIKNENTNILEKLSKHTGSVQDLQLQLENALLELRSKNELIASLKKNIESMSATRGGKDKEVERLRKELNQAMNSVRELEKEHAVIKDKYERLLNELKEKDIELEEQKIMSSAKVTTVRQSVDDYKDLEIQALKDKIDEIQKQGNLPDSFLAAEKAETEKYREKVKELYMQISDLQEEVEFYQKEIVEIKRQGNAKALVSRVPDAKEEKIDYKTKFEENAKELARLRVECKEYNQRMQEAENMLKGMKDEMYKAEMIQKRQQQELSDWQNKFKETELRKSAVLSKNRETISNIIANYTNVMPKLQLVIPGTFSLPEVVRISENVTTRILTSKEIKK